MILRALLVLLLGVMLSSVVSAQEVVLFNGSVAEGGVVTILTQEYELSVSDNNATSILLTQGNESIILGEENCKNFEYQRVCHDEKISDKAARIVIFDVRPFLEFAIDVNQTDNLIAGDSVGVVIWMNNTGMVSAKNVVMSSRIPQNMSLVHYDNCKFNETHITFKGEISVDDYFDCRYVLKVNDILLDTINATVDYFSFNTTNVSFASSEVIEAEMPFVLNVTNEDLSSVSPGKPFRISVHVLNENEDENLTLESVLVDFDSFIEVKSVSSPKASVDGDSIKFYRNKLEFNESFDFYADFINSEIESSGEIIFTFEYSMTDDDVVRTFQRKVVYGTGLTDIELWLDPANPVYESLEDAVLSVYVRNSNPYLTLKGYDVQISGDLLKKPYLNQIPYLSSRKIADIEFTLPQVDQQKIIPLTVSVVAKTLDNAIISKLEEFDITVLPSAGVLIEKNISLVENGYSLSVFAKNLHHIPINISLSEVLPEGLFVSGSSSSKVSLEPGQQVRAYSFTFLYSAQDNESLEFVTNYIYEYKSKPLEGQELFIVDKNVLLSGSLEMNNSVSSSQELNSSLPATENSPLEVNTSVINSSHDGNSIMKDLFTMQFSQNTLIIAAAIFILVCGLGIFFMVRRSSRFSKEKIPLEHQEHHELLRQEHTALLSEKTNLHQQKTQLTTEYQKIGAKISHLQKYLLEYGQSVPVEFSKLEVQRKQIRDIEQHVLQKRQMILDKEKVLQEEEKGILEYSARLEAIEKDIDTKEQKIRNDKQTLEADLVKLRQEQEKVKLFESQLLAQENALKNKLGTFKVRQVKHYRNRLTDLSIKKSEFHKNEEKLFEEEKKIHEEFSKVKQDLQISEEDLSNAEKVYKEATSAVTETKDGPKT